MKSEESIKSRLMTFEDYQELLKGSMSKYYEGRWEYFDKVIELIKNENMESVLEIGPAQHPIVKDCDVMIKPEDDMWGRPKKGFAKQYLHDATEKPWPIKDKQYDLVLGLQVWEHLDNKQSRSFRELMRTSKMAILSFPYIWNCPKDNANYPAHHLIDEELIGDWTLNVGPEKIIKIPRTGPEVSKGPRIIYFWKF